MLFLCISWLQSIAQPAICGANPQMASTCMDACVICDIDGFTGVNNQNLPGQSFTGFCTTQFNKMQYIAFIAGSVDIRIEIVVSNCLTSLGLEVGFFRSDDCMTFTPITDCDTDIQANTTRIFENIVPLTIGQHYYLVMDGSAGATCNWTFNVLEGSTAVPLLPPTPPINNDEFTCVDEQTLFSTTEIEGAALYFWKVDGTQVQVSTVPQTFLTFAAAGFYEVCVSAANACDEADESCNTIQVYGPSTTQIDTVLCDGDCLDVVGNILCLSGTYDFLVPDQFGCDSTINVDMTILPQPSESIDINMCNGEFFQVGDQFYSTTGIFETTVLTSMDCDSIVTLDLFIVECDIMGSTTTIQPICTGESTGTLVFSVENGTPPFTYDYSLITEPSVTGTGSTILFANNEINGVPAGFYEINIFDTFGNTVVLFAEVTDPPVLNNMLQASDINGTNVSCFDGNDGSLLAFPSGGVPPYTYAWSESSITSGINNLAAGPYTCTVMDSYGCPIESSFVMTSPPAIIPDVLFTDPNCDGPETGKIDVLDVAGGVGPFLYGTDGITYGSSSSFSELSPGWNDIYVQDANGCVVSLSDSLKVPDIPFIELGDEVMIDLGDSHFFSPITNNSSLIEIVWQDSSSLDCGSCLEVNATPYNDANYVLTVTSVDDCMTSDEVFLRVRKVRNVYIPNVFSPNDDGANDKFFIQSGKAVSEILSLQIYDRWGETVYEIGNHPPNDPSYGWDGRLNGKDLQGSLFVYRVSVKYLDDEVINFKGDFAVLR